VKEKCRHSNVEVVATVMGMMEDVGMTSDDGQRRSASTSGAREMRDVSGTND
jgi:hypothetical protein